MPNFMIPSLAFGRYLTHVDVTDLVGDLRNGALRFVNERNISNAVGKGRLWQIENQNRKSKRLKQRPLNEQSAPNR
jgi:hypothetical protein